MGATVVLLGAVRLVCYRLSRFPVLPQILQNWRSGLASWYFLFFQLGKLWESALY